VMPMRCSTRQLGFLVLLSALFVCGSVAVAALPGPAPTDGPPVVQPAPDRSAVEVATETSVEGAICRDPAEDPFATSVVPAVTGPLQTGQPCCAALCDATCGVGEPCLCKRCQVLGCGV